MSPELGVAVMMNNYFHDVATALLLASSAALWIMARELDPSADPATGRYFLRIYRSMTRVALFSLAWIVLGGIPRTIFYVSFEWANAAGKGQVPALVVKHVLIAVLLALGTFGWLKIRRRVSQTRARVG